MSGANLYRCWAAAAALTAAGASPAAAGEFTMRMQPASGTAQAAFSVPNSNDGQEKAPVDNCGLDTSPLPRSPDGNGVGTG